jgi:hypothetical protein
VQYEKVLLRAYYFSINECMFLLDKLWDVEFFLNNVQINHNEMMELIYHHLNDVAVRVLGLINNGKYHYKIFVLHINIPQKIPE